MLTRGPGGDRTSGQAETDRVRHYGTSTDDGFVRQGRWKMIVAIVPSGRRRFRQDGEHDGAASCSWRTGKHLPAVSAPREEGFDGHRAYDAGSPRLVSSVRSDLVLLDVMLPDGDGKDLCRELRTKSDVPIVMLTARGEDVDKIVGLELGADDYVVKPFSVGELVARIRAILRRGTRSTPHGVIRVGAIQLDHDARTVSRSGGPVVLAAREFDLLALLMSNAGRVVRREQIMDDVDPHWFGSTKTLDVHIAWLRKSSRTIPRIPATSPPSEGRVPVRVAKTDKRGAAD